MGDDIFETNGVRQPEADQYDSNSIKTVEGWSMCVCALECTSASWVTAVIPMMAFMC